MESVLKDMEARLEKERKAREREEQKHVPGEKGQKTSTLHRDSDFTLESPDGRVSPLPMAARPLTTRSAGETTRKSKTDATVCYSPSRGNESAARLTGNGVSRSVERGRQRELLLGEFERRLLNAKRLGKAPMPSVEDIPWYHPSVSRHIAESLLMHPDILPGTYLMRNSTNSNDSLTLSVRCRTALRHYRVLWDGRQFCFGLGKFPDVAALSEHFRQQPMISGDCSVLVKLCHPYPRRVVEPHDYQEANEVIAGAAMEITTELSNPSLAVNSKEGFLTKLGYHRKNWKIRWFSLFRNELKYFNTKDDKTPLRVIHLEDAKGVERDDSMGKPHCLRLIMPYRTFFMIASSDEEADDWVQVLSWRLESNSREQHSHTRTSL
jgi:dual adaptor for phosphotyrosine/3-phosphotyrosine/3-phosphoinositide